MSSWVQIFEFQLTFREQKFDVIMRDSQKSSVTALATLNGEYSITRWTSIGSYTSHIEHSEAILNDFDMSNAQAVHGKLLELLQVSVRGQASYFVDRTFNEPNL